MPDVVIRQAIHVAFDLTKGRLESLLLLIEKLFSGSLYVHLLWFFN